jgi:hypothetical protein
VTISHETLKTGDACPGCLEANLSGKLSGHLSGVFIRLKGSPLVTGTRYLAQGFRCNLCGEIYKPAVCAYLHENDHDFAFMLITHLH